MTNKEERLIKRAILILCRNVQPNGDLTHFSWDDRRDLINIYRKLIKEQEENET